MGTIFGNAALKRITLQTSVKRPFVRIYLSLLHGVVKDYP